MDEGAQWDVSKAPSDVVWSAQNLVVAPGGRVHSFHLRIDLAKDPVAVLHEADAGLGAVLAGLTTPFEGTFEGPRAALARTDLPLPPKSQASSYVRLSAELAGHALDERVLSLFGFPGGPTKQVSTFQQLQHAPIVVQRRCALAAAFAALPPQSESVTRAVILENPGRGLFDENREQLLATIRDACMALRVAALVLEPYSPRIRPQKQLPTRLLGEDRALRSKAEE
jgi:hypothetical protein